MDFEQREDGDIEFSGKASTFKEITMEHLRRITSLASVEFRGGHYTIFVSKTGEEKEIYVPDTREVYSNAVLILAFLLKPKFDKKMEEKFKEFNEKLEQIKKEFIEASSVEEEVVLGEGFYDNNKDKLLLETYKQKKLILYLELFSNISYHLGRLNYMEISGETFS